MNIQLPDNLENSVRSLVNGGRFASVDDAMTEAARLLLKQATPHQQPANKDAFHQRLIDMGLMTQLPDTANDYDDPDDQPITIEGEPISETIIRERR